VVCAPFTRNDADPVGIVEAYAARIGLKG
jgi:hypothetical protein